MAKFLWDYGNAAKNSNDQYHNYWEGNKFEKEASLWWGGYKTMWSPGHFQLC
jgi:hypothetical protein